jgi:hypothetical protein
MEKPTNCGARPPGTRQQAPQARRGMMEKTYSLWSQAIGHTLATGNNPGDTAWRPTLCGDQTIGQALANGNKPA